MSTIKACVPPSITSSNQSMQKPNTYTYTSILALNGSMLRNVSTAPFQHQ
jgi:hypothetical protein